jgi:chromosome segregation ATPase
MLAKLARTLSPHELSRLDIDKLPAHIPPEMLRGAPQKNREVLHDMLVELEAKRTHEHVEDLHCFGKEIATAFQKAESARAPAKGNVLGERLRELAGQLHSWRKSRQARNGTNLQKLHDKIDEVGENVIELRDEVADFNQAEYILKHKASKAGAARARISDAIMRLREKTSPAKCRLSQYYSLRLSICYQEMKDLRAAIERSYQEQSDLDAHIESLREELEAKQSIWRKAIRKYRSGDDYTEIQNQITCLVAEKRACEVIVPEEKLQRWLDSIVDASLDTTSNTLSKNLLPAARAQLYWLLTQYCYQQENSAKQIARSPFVQVNAEDAIQFLLLSEQFLLDYFMRRRNENLFWFSSAVEERRDALDGMLNDLMRELKHNLKAFA